MTREELIKEMTTDFRADQIQKILDIIDRHEKDLRNGNVSFKGYQPTVAIDFDGVIHRYGKGWKDGSIYDSMNDGTQEAIKTIQDAGFKVVIFSSRNPDQIHEWLKFYDGFDGIEITSHKPTALVYIDDRGLRFTDWTQAIETLKELKILR